MQGSARQGRGCRGTSWLGLAPQCWSGQGWSRLGAAWRGAAPLVEAGPGTAGHGAARLGEARHDSTWLPFPSLGLAPLETWRVVASRGTARRDGAGQVLAPLHPGETWRGVARLGKARRGWSRHVSPTNIAGGLA